MDPLADRWWRFVMASPSLRARLHELYDEATEGIALELGGAKADGRARLTAGVIVLTVRTARHEAFRIVEHGGSAKKASATFFALLDRGFAAAHALWSDQPPTAY